MTQAEIAQTPEGQALIAAALDSDAKWTTAPMVWAESRGEWVVDADYYRDVIRPSDRALNAAVRALGKLVAEVKS